MMHVLDRLVLGVRFLLIGFYLGLAAALAAYCVHFLSKVWKFVGQAAMPESTTYLLSLLELVDSVLVAGLVVMVVLSSWDSFVSPLSKTLGQGSKIEWVSQLDPTNLKTKLATAIIAISSIHLLQMFMRTESYADRDMLWAVIIHMAFVAGALALFWMDHSGAMGKLRSSAPKMSAGAPAAPQPVHRPGDNA